MNEDTHLFSKWLSCKSDPEYGQLNKGRKQFGERIKKAEKFILSAESARAVQELTCKETKKNNGNLFIHYRQLMKAPYKSVWVEMPMTAEVKSLRHTPETTEFISPVIHIGMLIEQIRDNVFVLTASWEVAQGCFEFATYSTVVDLNDEPIVNFSSLPINIAAYKQTIADGKDHNGEHLTESLARCAWIPSPFFISIFGGIPPEEGARMFNSYVHKAMERGINLFKESVEENDTLFGAWLMLLNAKSGITKVRTQQIKTRATNAIDPKTKKNRVKVMSTIGYTRIIMNDYEKEDGTPKPSFIERHRHMVRGHFKRRSTGIYWWNPFMRGNGAEKERIAYICEIAA